VGVIIILITHVFGWLVEFLACVLDLGEGGSWPDRRCDVLVLSFLSRCRWCIFHTFGFSLSLCVYVALSCRHCHELFVWRVIRVPKSCCAVRNLTAAL
jgi:hypothetical protein